MPKPTTQDTTMAAAIDSRPIRFDVFDELLSFIAQCPF
jgi:hypothetical protein